MDVREKKIVEVQSSQSPEIGRWLWALQDTRQLTLEELDGVTSAMVDWLPQGSESSIGAILYHLAAIEADWLYAEVLELPFPAAVVSLFPYNVRDEEGRLSQVQGVNLTEHLERLATVRSLLLDAFQGMELSEFRRVRSLEQYDVTPEWVLHHLMQHEAEHRSQIGSLRDRAKRNLKSHGHDAIRAGFVAACRADPRIVAAFVGGSHATGKVDGWSDLDLYLITTDDAYEEFVAGKQDFVRKLGEPLFLEDFGTPWANFVIFADGNEVELMIGRAGKFKHIHGGAYTPLVDKEGMLDGVEFPLHVADPGAQLETLNELVVGFWHEVSHFGKALARGQLWFAYGSLEVMRNICVNLARLRHNFADAYVGEEPYFKIEDAMPVEQLTPLQATFCPLAPAALRQAGQIVLQFYQEVAMSLAQSHGITYPAELEDLMVSRSERLGDGPVQWTS